MLMTRNGRMQIEGERERKDSRKRKKGTRYLLTAVTLRVPGYLTLHLMAGCTFTWKLRLLHSIYSICRMYEVLYTVYLTPTCLHPPGQLPKYTVLHL